MGLGATAAQASSSLHNPKEPLPDHPALAFEVKYINMGFPGDSVVSLCLLKCGFDPWV